MALLRLHLFLPVNRNLIQLHRLALFTGYKREH